MLNILTTKKGVGTRSLESEGYVNYFDYGDSIMGVCMSIFIKLYTLNMYSFCLSILSQ